MVRKKLTLCRIFCLCLLAAVLASCTPAVFAKEAARGSAQTITELTQIGATSLDEEGEAAPMYRDIAGEAYEEAAESLSEFGILKGYDDGTFRGEEILTRAEFATLVMRLTTPGDELKIPAETKKSFSDVSDGHWAYPGIVLAAEKGFIDGYPDGSFSPDAPVTFNQAVKILVCALGFGGRAEDKGPYPYGYLLEAVEQGITKSIAARFENPLSRGLAAQMLNNTLDLPHKESGVTPRQIKTGVYATYYVSPKGSDSNPGTEAEPWKTIYYAVTQLKAGNMLILEDGDYFEKRSSTLKESGTEHAPIVVKARNKHKAKVTYGANMICNPKFEIRDASYIRVEDIMFRQEARAEATDSGPTRDIILAWYGGSHGIIRGNHLTNAFEEGLKFHRVTDCVIEDNYVSDTTHESLDAVDCTELIIRNNTFAEAGRCGIMVKGGSSDCQIYNNLVYNKDVTMTTCGITIGGSTDPVSTRSPKKEVGFEMYTTQIFNNIVYTPTKRFRWGMISYGSKDCRVFNNIVSGASVASMGVFNNNGLTNKWEWNPPTRNLLVYNNIFADSPAAWEFREEPEGLISDYNMYSNVGQTPEEPNSIYGNAAFADAASIDFRLPANSPAIGAGYPIPAEFVGYDNQTREIPLIDYEGNERKGVWDIGIYQMSK